MWRTPALAHSRAMAGTHRGPASEKSKTTDLTRQEKAMHMHPEISRELAGQRGGLPRQHLGGRGAGTQVLDQPGLADACRAGDQDEL